jgi:hypothetical protein
MQVRAAMKGEAWEAVDDLMRNFDIGGCATEATEELAMVQDELNDRAILSVLSQALAGDPNDIDGLTGSIGHAKAKGVKSQRAQVLLHLAEAMQSLRTALLNKDWDRVKAALMIIEEQQEDGEDFADFLRDELTAAQQQLDDHNAIEMLSAALEVGMAAGSVGALNTLCVEVQALKEALSYVQTHGCKSADAVQMTRVAQLILQLREQMVLDDWDQVDALLEQSLAQQLLGNAKSSNGWVKTADEQSGKTYYFDTRSRRSSWTKPDMGCIRKSVYQTNTLPLGGKELTLARRELSDRTMCTRLTEAISSGMAVGEPGALAIEDVEIDSLRESVHMAEDKDAEDSGSARLQRLYRTGALVMELREAMIQEDRNEVQLLLARFEGAKPKTYDSCGLDEIRMIQDDQAVRVVWDNLGAAFRTGMAEGAIGQLDLSTLETGPLETSIASATKLRVKTFKTERLVKWARIVYKVRLALSENDWEKVATLIRKADADPEGVAEEATMELTVVRDEVNNSKMIQLLTQALQSGQANGVTGHMDTTAIVVVQLREAVGFATEKGGKSDEARQLLHTGRIILKLRQALKARDWAAAKQAVREAQESKSVDEEDSNQFNQGFLAGIAQDEIFQANEEIDNHLTIAKLINALHTGQLKGSVGHMDCSTVTTELLESAIEEAETVGCRTSQAQQLLHTARIIESLRSKILANQWDELEAEVQLAMNGQVADAAMEEVELILAEAQDRKIMRQLTLALAHSGGDEHEHTGLHQDVLGMLEANNITGNSHDRKMSPDAERQKGELTHVNEMRSFQESGDWESLHSMTSCTDFSSLPEEVRKEVEVARYQANDRLTIHHLQHALSTNRVMPDENGIVDTENVNTYMLMEVSQHLSWAIISYL